MTRLGNWTLSLEPGPLQSAGRQVSQVQLEKFAALAGISTTAPKTAGFGS